MSRLRIRLRSVLHGAAAGRLASPFCSPASSVVSDRGGLLVGSGVVVAVPEAHLQVAFHAVNRGEV